MYNYYMYRIAGNFRGPKFSRMTPKIHFADFNFAFPCGRPISYRIKSKFADFIFAFGCNIAKFAKILGHENFLLYGMNLIGVALSIQPLWVYRISGNFRGALFSRIS